MRLNIFLFIIVLLSISCNANAREIYFVCNETINNSSGYENAPDVGTTKVGQNFTRTYIFDEKNSLLKMANQIYKCALEDTSLNCTYVNSNNGSKANNYIAIDRVSLNIYTDFRYEFEQEIFGVKQTYLHSKGSCNIKNSKQF